ncbi:DUF397 domain-containing protein [Streptomyces griseorubiginosus]|uniref:DUF397 domain-containing protein n=1 Tax=Streptomyces griseorubiginosus TaxID=67304 RepID=UPI003654AA50
MTASAPWKKSSFSGGGEGNDCVQIADMCSHVAVRASKAPDTATLTFPAGSFTAFLEALKSPRPTRG